MEVITLQVRFREMTVRGLKAKWRQEVGDKMAACSGWCCGETENTHTILAEW